MRMTSWKAVIVGACLAVVAAAAAAQDADAQAEKDTLERAKAEKAVDEAAQRKAEKRKAKAEARAAEDKAEEARREKLHIDPADAIPEEQPGFFASVEVMAAEVGGADRTVARAGDIVTTATTAEELDLVNHPAPEDAGLPDAFSIGSSRNLTLGYDSEIAPIIEVGYRTKAGKAVSLRWFGISSSSSLDLASSMTFPSQDPLQGDLILGGIDNQGFENVTGAYGANPDGFERPFGSPAVVVAPSQYHGADSISASGELEAQRWDLLYSKTGIARKRFELSYRVGLELLDISRSEEATFTWRSTSRDRVLVHATTIEEVSASTDTTALGPIAGIAGRFGFTKSRAWSVRLGVDVAGLKASRETSFRDVAQFSQDALPTQPLTVIQDVADNDADDFITAIDSELALEYRFHERFRLGLGYRQGWWFSALSEERFPSAANPSLLESDTLDLDVGGPFVRFDAWF